MYGGLFGDLPAAKNAPKGDGNEKSAKPSANTTNNQTKHNESLPPTSSGSVNSSASPTLASAAGKKGPGAGTAPAFIPLAARARRKPNMTATTNSSAISKKPQPLDGSAIPTTVPLTTQSALGDRTPVSSITYASHRTETMVLEPKHEHVVTNIHEDASSAGISFSSSLRPMETEETKDPWHEDPVRSEEPRYLPDNVIEDPYDPMVPNDLLQYWQRKSYEKERINLEKERQLALDRQERIREQLQKERDELARSGDVQKLAQRSFGRGRGVSNLPAWLVGKEKRRNTTLDGVNTKVSEKEEN